MQNLTIDIRELVAYCDEEGAGWRHAKTSKEIVGDELALPMLARYFRERRRESEILAEPCTTGNTRGPHLSGWLHVKSPGVGTLYQVQVKTWSRLSVRGRHLGLDASPNETARFKKQRWERYWDEGRFTDHELNQVLTPMDSPRAGIPVEPLACLWDAVHPTGGLEALFSVACAESVFQKVNVFSIFAFLRSKNVPTIDVAVPDESTGLRWLAGEIPGWKIAEV
jgi:hypothetical protein